VLVVGGGIAGLAAAWEATGRGDEVTVLEASPRWGGLIRTSPMEVPAHDGHPGGTLVIDEAADAFLARVPDAVELCRELGLVDRFTEPAARRAMVWDGSALRWFPARQALGVPLDLEDLAATGLVSEQAIAAVAEEAAGEHAPLDHDVAVGPFLRGRLGDEVVDRVVAPLLGGINAGDVESMSLRAVAPQLADAAAAGGSLCAELARRASKAPEGPVFHGLLGGTATLVDALVDHLTDRGADLRTGTPVARVGVDAGDGRASVTTASGDTFHGDLVVVTTPAPAAAAMLADTSAETARALATIRLASVVLVTFLFERSDVPGAGDGGEDATLCASGFLVPRRAGLLLAAASWGSLKWRHWDDGRHFTVRASAGHVDDDRVVHMGDDEVVAGLLADLRTTMGITAPPVATRVSRWHDGFHQYAVGHLDLVERIEATLDADTGGRVRVAGCAYRGVGIPACIRSGRAAVA
jgi:oxygen-dependent protoporphyrinogen oxidase